MPSRTLDELREMQRTMWKLHPPLTSNAYGWIEEVGPKLSPEAVQEVFAAIEEHSLVCELTSVGFGFGHIGVNLYLDEQFPGTGAEFVFCLSERHLDPKAYPWVESPTGGDVHPEAWELFRPAWQPANIGRLKALGLEIQTQGDLSY